MQRRSVPGAEVPIDTCSHGTWFDARELRIVAQALERAITPPAPAPPPAIPSRPRSYGEQFGVDTVETFGDLAGMILRFLDFLFDDRNRFP